MKLSEFKQLFEWTLETAADNIENKYKVSLSRTFQINFNGVGFHNDLIDVDAAIRRMYLGDDLFFSVIDVMVTEADDHVTTAYVGVTGHRPVPTIDQNWNEPPGSGPFKQKVSAQFLYKGKSLGFCAATG